MRRPSDPKLDALAASPLGAGRSVGALQTLGRLADLAEIPAGTVLQRQGSWAPWSYCLLDGVALLSSSDEAIAVAPAGSWLLGARRDVGGYPVAVTAVTATDTVALCFRPRDLAEAVHAVPRLLPIRV